MSRTRSTNTSVRAAFLAACWLVWLGGLISFLWILSVAVHGKRDAVNPHQFGSKAAAHYHAVVRTCWPPSVCRDRGGKRCQVLTDVVGMMHGTEPGQSYVVRVRFADRAHEAPFADFDRIFAQRQQVCARDGSSAPDDH